MLAGQRHKADGAKLPGNDLSLFGLFEQQKCLRHEAAAHRDNHSATRLQLFNQRRWHVAGGSRDDDGIERSVLFPAVIAVTEPL